MAKKKTSLKDKLKSERINRNTLKEVPLVSKKPLVAKQKNIKAVEAQVESIHKEEAIPNPPKPKKAPKEAVVRLTVDVPKSTHKKIKMKMVELETKIQRYLVRLINEDLGI